MSLHHFDIAGIFAVQLAEMDHESRQQRLAGFFSRRSQRAGEPEGNAGVFVLHLHGRAQAHDVVQDALDQAHRAGHCRADDILAFGGVAAVSLGLEAGNPLALRKKGDCRHAQALILVISTLV